MKSQYKKITSHGSVSIPVAMRRELALEPKDPVELEIRNGEVRIKPYNLRCQICGETDRVKQIGGKGICYACAYAAWGMHGGFKDVGRTE